MSSSLFLSLCVSLLDLSYWVWLIIKCVILSIENDTDVPVIKITGSVNTSLSRDEYIHFAQNHRQR